MIRRLLKKLEPIIYVQIWEHRIKVTDIQTRENYDEAALVAIEKNQKGQKIVSAVGNDAKAIAPTSSIEIIKPFCHPRVLLNDFHVAEKLLQHIFHVLLGKKFISPVPIVVVHPMEKVEGGLTMIERKAFTEIALGAGAREAIIYQGTELSISTFDINHIKKANLKSEPSYVELNPKKENYFVFVFWAIVIGVALWFSN